jgi:hypothetical protein
LKKLHYISIIILILIISCKSNKPNSEYFENILKFEFIEINDEFKMELTEFHPNISYCYTEGVPYALLIGKPLNSQLPKKISVLSYCEDRVYDVGKLLTITPTKKPKIAQSMSLIYLAKDTIINGEKKHWLLGSENKTIWGIPNQVE